LHRFSLFPLILIFDPPPPSPPRSVIACLAPEVIVYLFFDISGICTILI
jgi:hypothetical protein